MGKGFVNKIVADPFLKGTEVADVEYSYGQIRLKTTEKKLEEFVDNLIDNEQDFKVIDYFEENKRYNKTELISLITEWLTEDPDSPCVDDYDVVKHLLTYYSHIIYS